jgi:hypothetical protein
MLMARRLVERGTGFVAVNTAFVWDNHSDVNNAPMKDAMPWLAPVTKAVLPCREKPSKTERLAMKTPNSRVAQPGHATARWRARAH